MRLFTDTNTGRQLYISQGGVRVGERALKELFRLALTDAEAAYAKIVALGLTQRDWEYLRKAADRAAGE